MSSAANWEGRLRRRYAGVVNPLPSPNTLADYLPFVEKDKVLGDDYQIGVDLGIEHGVTHDNTRTNYTFRSAIDSVNLPARLRGSSISMIGDIPRDLLHAMKTAAQTNGDMSGLDSKVKMTALGAEFYRELMLHYGAGPAAATVGDIGVVSTVVSGTNLGAGGPVVVDLTRASFSAGLWNLMTNGLVDIVQADGSTVVETDVSVTFVKGAGANRLSLSKSGAATDVDATDLILPAGTITKSAVGVHGILTNTGSLFGISAATYPQWQAESYAAGGAMTRAKVLALAARLGNNGLTAGGKLFVNHNTFADLSEEASDQISFDTKNGRTPAIKEMGAQNLLYKTPAGPIEVAVDLVMKQGIAMFIGKGPNRKPVGCRVGSTDNTFLVPGEKSIIHKLEGSAGSRVECYSNQAPLLKIPYHCALITGITNTADTVPSA